MVMDRQLSLSSTSMESSTKQHHEGAGGASGAGVNPVAAAAAAAVKATRKGATPLPGSGIFVRSDNDRTNSSDSAAVGGKRGNSDVRFSTDGENSL